jgi:hypothetical protein
LAAFDEGADNDKVYAKKGDKNKKKKGKKGEIDSKD